MRRKGVVAVNRVTASLGCLAGCVVMLAAAGASAATIAERAFEQLRAAPPACADAFDFVACGDTRSAEPVVLPKAFYAMIGEWNTLKPAFVIDSGDLILGGPLSELDAMWAEFEKAVGTCSVPFFPVPGNHDVNKDPEVVGRYEDRIGPLAYAFSYGNSRFVILNSEDATELGRLSDAQLDWLKEDLDATRATNIFLFLHQPFFAQDWDAHWAGAAEVIKGHPVKVVFGGHEHLYRDYGTRDGVRYVISGGGGAENTAPEKEGGFPHYLWVRVRGDRVDWSVIRPGAIFPSNLVTQEKVEAARALQRLLKTEAVEVPWGESLDRPVSVSLENPGPDALRSKLTWTVPAGWHVDPTERPIDLAAGATAPLTFQVRADSPAQVRFPVPVASVALPVPGLPEPLAIEQPLDLIPTVAAPHSGGPVACDGVLGEWTRARSVPLTYPVGFDLKNTDDLQASAHVMWDESFLYLAVEVEDNTFHQPYAGDIVWSADSVELWLEDSVWSFSLTNQGPQVFVDCIGKREIESVMPTVSLGVARDNQHCVYEAAFPAAEIPFLSLAPGASFRFSLIVNDLDPSGPVASRHCLDLTPGASDHFNGPKMKALLEN